MPSYTTSLKLLQPSTGEYPGSWGSEINTRMTSLVDAAVAGTTTVTMTAANVTLTNANGVADQAKSMFLVLQGSPGGSYEVIVPSASKLYFVTNSTGFAQTVKTSGSGISVPNGASMTLRCDGTNVVVAQNYFASMTLGSALPATSGGTGLTSFTSGGVVYASSSSALATGSGLVFNGTNLGIGTSSPTVKLDVQGIANFYSGAAGTFSFINVGRTASEARVGVAAATNDFLTGTTAGDSVFYQVASGNAWYGTAATGSAIFTTNNTERMRLDSSGNLGLGVTPSAWGGGMKALEMSNGSVSISANGPYINQNAFYDTAWKYKQDGLAAQYQQYAGQHQWYTAPSGTAGNAISFTQAMTLDASGQLSVGTPLTENSTGVYLLPTGEMRVKDNTENGTSQISIYNNNTTNDIEQFFVAMNGADVEIGNRRPDGGALKIFTLNTERARLDASGNLGIGTSSIISRLHVVSPGQTIARLKGGSGSGQSSALYIERAGSSTTLAAFGDAGAIVGGTVDQAVAIYADGSIPITFMQSTTERARIDASGNLGIGTSSPGSKLDVNGAATFAGGAQTTPVTVTFSATAMTVDCALSNVFATTFTANVTTAPTISNPRNGQTINWFITQDGTGSRTMTWPSSFRWPSGATRTLSTAANSVDLLVATYLSSTGFWYASLSKGFTA